MEDCMSSGDEAMADLKAKLTVLTRPEYGGASAFQINYVTAQNILHEETGRYGEHEIEYQFSRKTKDTLLAHGRQDAAHALWNTKSLLDLNNKISSQLNTLNSLMVIALCLLGSIVVKLYPQILSWLHLQ